MRLVRSAAGSLAARDPDRAAGTGTVPAMPGCEWISTGKSARSCRNHATNATGPMQNKRKADLRLDLPGWLFRSADDTTIVVPGKPDESELLARITSDDPERADASAEDGDRLSPNRSS